MTSFNWNEDTRFLVISGNGTLERQDANSEAIHIAVEGFQALGDRCFSDYAELVSISLPDSLVTIGNNILENTKVAELHLPKSVYYVSNSQSFDGQFYLGNITVDPENHYFRDVDGVLYSKNMKELHFYPGNRPETTCIVPNGVEIIKVGALGDSLNRTEIIIPSSVKTIEWGFGYRSLAIEKIIILQCPSLVKINKYMLLGGTSKGEEIIHFEYTRCIRPVTCKHVNNRSLSFHSLLSLIIMMS